MRSKPSCLLMRVALSNISKSYSGNQVLDRVSLTIEEGQIHALVGENGAGKSTLMKILIGVEKADEGEILINGRKKEWRDPLEARQAGLAMVYQELTLIPSLSIVENIFLGRLRRRRMSFVQWNEMAQEAKSVLRSLGTDLTPGLKVEHLSIAEQQMVEIARALTHQAELIILDEPTSALSNNDVDNLFRALRKLNENGVSVLYITHRLQELFQIAHRLSVLRDGRLIRSLPISEVDIHSVIRAMVGRELKEQFPPKSKSVVHKSRPVALRLQVLNEHSPFSGVSLELRRGEILGIAGLVGSGRTEFIEAIFGVNGFLDSKIEVFGKKVRIKTPTSAVQVGLGLIPDDRKTKGLVTAADVSFNLTMATQSKFSTTLGWRHKEKEFSAARHLITELKIKVASVKQQVSRLSGGNQQKVAIGKTLNTDSNILIFDEPTRGIDVGAKREIYFLLRKLAEEGAAIILVSSEMEEILGLSDTIMVMHQGQITGKLSAEEATQEKIIHLAVGI